MLEEEVARYIEMHHILLCGDFNSRTGQAPVYEAGVIDTSVNVPNQRSDEDKVINKYGQLLGPTQVLYKHRFQNSQWADV